MLKLLSKGSEAAKIAHFYGFLPVEWPKVSREDLNSVRDLEEEWHPEEGAVILRIFNELKANSMPMPLMLYLEKSSSNKESRKKSKIECTLSVLLSQRSVAESLVLQAARGILENAGWKDMSVRINSVGNKESVAEFERKMSAFIRKRVADFPAELRQALKKDIYFLIKSREEKYKEWRECAPQSLDCLSEQSRLHFKEMLEFLETVEFPYIIDTSLIGDIEYATETIFEIISDGTQEVLARGCRWNRLSRKLDYKKEIPAVSVTISAKSSRAPKQLSIKKASPQFYLVQFGPDAKQKSFIALEGLRKAGIAVSHSLAKDKLTGQMSSLEQAGIPYMILIGQKEAIDNVAVIRNATTRAQITVAISDLGDFIKKSSEFK